MNSFTECRGVEAEGVAQVVPFMKEKGIDLISTEGDMDIQKHYGDFITETNGKKTYIELKVEEKTTGNLFPEVWSNRSRKTPGWLGTLTNCDILWYYFLDTQILHMMNFVELREYCRKNYKRYNLVPHRKRIQLNDSWGLLVPIRHLKRDLSSYEDIHVD